MAFYFIQDVIICYCHYLFWYSPDLATGGLFKLTSGSFDMFHHVFSTFLTFWHNKMFQAYFVLSLPGINYFSNES